MSIQRGLLTCVIAIGIGLHACFLYALHCCPMHAYSFTCAHISPVIDRQLFDNLKKKERSILLGQIFDQISAVHPEVKEELHALKPEFTPPAAVAFPHTEPLLLEEKPFALHGDAWNFLHAEEGAVVAWDQQPLITMASARQCEMLPFMTDLFTERNDYEGLDILAGSDHFDVAVEYTQKQDRPGYIFKLTFSPKSDVLFKRIRQNYFFLIDRSNSIPRARFALNKEVTSKALEYLKPQDTFNIFFFDDKIYRFSPANVSWNEDNVQKARQFLSMQSHGGYFAATELYSSLGKIIPTTTSDQEVNTAILFSDGDTYLSQERQRQTIGGWTRQNQGRVTLYSIASGGGNNLPLLELLSTLNKGALIYSYDHDLLTERLAQLMCAIHSPIGKEMVATVISTDPQASVLLQPKNHRLPDLYQNRSFIIYGSTNRLSDLVIFLQGKYYDHRFDIKKHISFEKASIGPPSIEKAWAQLIAQEFYENFFQDGNRKHLEAIKQLLLPMHLSTPFIVD